MLDDKKKSTVSLIIQTMIAILTALAGVFTGCQMA
ncbi:MAG: smalltalk protein [Bacteroidales bacterium]|nr:smalltalk protein [Bacteroidales bacterium]MCI7315173.1 smalltalk protein [Bacteroidales bacterium]MDD6584219.1 smalltalk protein [Bacteroidales bacterium]MDD6922374.1 smalltalk protein [Bacteroidales bacterium]MEE0903255.1 smalltalk protein [Prevotellamassilia sp.]